MLDYSIDEELSMSKRQGWTLLRNSSAVKCQAMPPLAPSNWPERGLKPKLSSKDHNAANDKEALDPLDIGSCFF